MHVLVLGGTGEARDLATRLAAYGCVRVTYSLAGRTSTPVVPDCSVRTGGFGGADGLAEWLLAERVRVLVDATHPFAARISANAAAAARWAGIPLLTVRRPPWAPVAGDRWTPVPDLAAAAATLGPTPARVFLAIGRQEVAAFRAAPQHRYLIRAIEPPDAATLPPRAEVLLARGPFTEAGERDLLAGHRIEIVVTKNSGGADTVAKLAAARALGLPVIMVDRPPGPPAAPTVEAALAEIEAHRAALGE